MGVDSEDPSLLPSVRAGSELIGRLAREVAGARNAWRYLEDLRQVGELKLLEIRVEHPDVTLPFCRKRLEWAMEDWLRKERRLSNVIPIDRSDSQKVVAIDPPDPRLLPDEMARRKQRTGKLCGAVIELPVREQQVLKRLYRDGQTQKTVARELGVHQSRVAQIHRRTLARILPFVVQAAA